MMLLVLLLLSGACGADEQALAAEWRELRQIKGHFSGGSEWVEAIDSWRGRKHVVLAELGELLGHPGTPESRVLSLLGEPDRRTAGALVRTPDGTSLLVYQWRGLHDFLYFVLRDGRVVRSDWWMAGE